MLFKRLWRITILYALVYVVILKQGLVITRLSHRLNVQGNRTPLYSWFLK